MQNKAHRFLHNFRLPDTSNKTRLIIHHPAAAAQIYLLLLIFRKDFKELVDKGDELIHDLCLQR